MKCIFLQVMCTCISDFSGICRGGILLGRNKGLQMLEGPKQLPHNSRRLSWLLVMHLTWLLRISYQLVVALVCSFSSVLFLLNHLELPASIMLANLIFPADLNEHVM